MGNLFVLLILLVTTGTVLGSADDECPYRNPGIPIADTAAGDELGNGGDALVLREREYPFLLRNAMFFDFYEAANKWALCPDFNETGAYLEHVTFALDRLARLDPYRAEVLAERAERFPNEMLLWNAELPDVKDTGDIPVPRGWAIEQLAIQDDPEFPREEYRYIVAEDIWNGFLSTPLAHNRAGLVLHEIIYTDGILQGHKNSRKIRYFNAHVFSDVLDRMGRTAYLQLLKDVDLLRGRYDAEGLRMQVDTIRMHANDRLAAAELFDTDEHCYQGVAPTICFRQPSRVSFYDSGHIKETWLSRPLTWWLLDFETTLPAGTHVKFRGDGTIASADAGRATFAFSLAGRTFQVHSFVSSGSGQSQLAVPKDQEFKVQGMHFKSVGPVNLTIGPDPLVEGRFAIDVNLGRIFAEKFSRRQDEFVLERASGSFQIDEFTVRLENNALVKVSPNAIVTRLGWNHFCGKNYCGRLQHLDLDDRGNISTGFVYTDFTVEVDGSSCAWQPTSLGTMWFENNVINRIQFSFRLTCHWIVHDFQLNRDRQTLSLYSSGMVERSELSRNLRYLFSPDGERVGHVLPVPAHTEITFHENGMIAKAFVVGVFLHVDGTDDYIEAVANFNDQGLIESVEP